MGLIVRIDNSNFVRYCFIAMICLETNKITKINNLFILSKTIGKFTFSRVESIYELFIIP